MLVKLIERWNPDSVVCAWDKGRSKPRLKLLPEYKGHREKNRDPDEQKALLENIHITQKALHHLPVKQIVMEGIEADDIIGYLTTILKGQKIVVSNDRDMLQLVKSGTWVFLPDKNKVISNHNVEEFLGVPVEKYVLFKALVGDASDNIKGVHGVGPKKAKKIINENLTMPMEWEDIIDRNCQLMNIGYVLEDEDLKQIRQQYKTQKNKDVDITQVRYLLAKHDINYILNNFKGFSRAFKSLRKK